jgi:hypothetical protein
MNAPIIPKYGFNLIVGTLSLGIQCIRVVNIVAGTYYLIFEHDYKVRTCVDPVWKILDMFML